MNSFHRVSPSPRLRAKPSTPILPGLYVHVPFCQSKCHYCDFYSVTALDGIEPWLQAVNREIQLYRDHFGVFDSLYLGGGTPTVLPAHALDNLLTSLEMHFQFSPDVEVTVEANPDDVTHELLVLLRGLGVNRLSLGVQSLDDDALRFLGRRHSARQAQEAMAMARRAGFNNVGLDFIYGLPGQAEGDWLAQLERALGLAPEHLSCYQLTLENDTALGRMLRGGTLQPLDEETQRSFFLRTSEFLEDHGFCHYEISNFARGLQYCSRHNSKYWEHVPYLGLGPAAHSFCDRTRWWNVRSLERYCQELAAGRSPIEESELLDAEQLRLETLFLGFRTRAGIDLQWLDADPIAKEVSKQLVAEGLAWTDQERLKPTRAGMVVADGLPLRFCG